MEELHDLYRDRPTGQSVIYTVTGNALGQRAVLTASYDVPDNIDVNEESTRATAEAAFHKTFGAKAEITEFKYEIRGEADAAACAEANEAVEELVLKQVAEAQGRLAEMLGLDRPDSGDDYLLNGDLPKA